MQLVIALNFFALAIIMGGLFYVAHVNYKDDSQTYKYWSTGLLLDAIGLAIMGGLLGVVKNLTETHFFGTVANTLLMAALIFQTASIRTIRKELSQWGVKLIYIFVALFAIGWHFLKENLTVGQRLTAFGVIAVVLLVWQVFEIRKTGKVFFASKQLRFLFLSVIAELIFTVLRVAGALGAEHDIITAEQLPALGLVSVWIQYSLKIVVYIAVAGYWGELGAKKRAKAEFENEQFKVLDERQKTMISELGQMNKAATAGVYMASLTHELSQPMQGLSLNTDMLVQELRVAEPSIDFLRSTVADQCSDVQRMLGILAAMRSVFSATEGRPQKIVLPELLEKLEVIYGPEAAKRGVAIEYDSSPLAVVAANSGALQQVLLNIINNAFDALNENETLNPKIKISIHVENDWVICSIQDNGHGLPPSMHDEVFKLLKTTKVKGMGVGLWLSRYLIERDHGTLEAGPSPLGGAMFTIKLRRVSEALA